MTRININYNENQITEFPVNAVNQKAEKGSGEKKNQPTNNFYGGFLNPGQQDEIAQRRERASKEARKLIMDTFSGDRKLDDSQKNRQEHMKKLDDEIKESQSMIRELNEDQEKLKETYEVSDDSQEQKDLELLKKENAARRGKTTEPLTKEEIDRLAEIAKNGLTEYQSRAMDYEKQKTHFEEKVKDAKKEWYMEQQTIRAVDKERLKHHEMVNSQKDADAIMENAESEIFGMMIKDAVDEQDEKLDEIREEAEERAEKNEERDSSEEQPVDLVTERLENVLKGEKLQERVEQILQEELLTEEDIKGMIYDELL